MGSAFPCGIAAPSAARIRLSFVCRGDLLKVDTRVVSRKPQQRRQFLRTWGSTSDESHTCASRDHFSLLVYWKISTTHVILLKVNHVVLKASAVLSVVAVVTLAQYTSCLPVLF